jgi:hypothetical protein
MCDILNQMNALRSPNIRRYGLPLVLTATLLGAAACSKHLDDPYPTPSEQSTTITRDKNPSCAVEARNVDGRTVDFSIRATNEFAAGEYEVSGYTYQFGDEASDNNGNPVSEHHTYPHAGSFTVQAAMTMKVAPGVNVPFKGSEVGCEQITVTVRQ